jgi:HlyD family secretion protein
MKRPLAFLLLLLPAACGPSAPAGPKVETKRVKVERGNIELNVSATGDIKPVKEVELKSKASGQVVRFQKLPGEPVEEGELIAELDKKVEQRNLSLQESNLLTAEANLVRTRLQVEVDLTTAESEAAAAREDAKQKAAELARLEKLSGDLVTESELSTHRLAARLAEETAKRAEASLVFIKGRRDGDVKLAEADVLKARVAVDDARERLRDTELRSPIKGILLKKLVEEGQIVSSGISATSGGTAIAIVADVSRLFVEANVDETDIAKVKKGQRSEISLLSGSNDRFKGQVDLILPKGEIDSNVIVFKVRIGIDGEVFGRAYPGMTAAVSIKISERKGALLVASEAVRIEKDKTLVYVPDGDKSRAVPVKIGLDNGARAEVVEGLNEDDWVYVQHTSMPDANQNRGGRGGRMRF